MTAPSMLVGQILAGYRRHAGFTRRQVAVEARLPVHDIRRIERRGVTVSSCSALMAMALGSLVAKHQQGLDLDVVLGDVR